MRLGAGGATPAGSTCDLSLAYNWMRFPCDQDLAGDWRNLAKSVSYYYHMSYSPLGEKLSGWVDLGHRVLAAWIFRAMPGTPRTDRGWLLRTAETTNCSLL